MTFERLEGRQLLSGSTAGAIDPSFGDGGIASVSIPGSTLTSDLDAALQPDGKILIAGSEVDSSGYQNIALVRLDPNGAPDSTFGTDGVVTASFSAPDAEATRIVLDGSRILVVGDANGNFALARFNADGSPDTSFGTGGSVSLDLGSDDDKAFDAAIESNGTIIVDGQTGGQLALVGFNPNGTLDTSFGTGGKTITDAPDFTPSTDPTTDGSGNTLDGSGGVKILSDGSLLVVSNEQDTDGSGRVDLAYYTANGSLRSFGRGAAQSSAPDVVGFALAGEGKIITFSSDGTDTLQRYNADASLDKTFGTDGTATAVLDAGGDGTITPDGKIIVAGTASVGSTEGVAVARYSADGTLDTSFGTDGIAVSPSAGYTAATAVVDPAGNVIAVGSSYETTAGDTAGAGTFSAVRYLGSVGQTAPTATLTSAPTLIHTGENQELLTITYAGGNIDPNSLQDENITVTRDGTPDGSTDTLPTYFLNSTQHADGSTTVVYQVQKDYSGHYFDALDDGNYAISIDAGAVYSLDGAPVAAGRLGSFKINIAAPPGGLTGPTAALAPTTINTIDVTDATLSVTFSTPYGIDANSFTGGLTITGPNGFDQTVWYESESTNSDGTVTAKYDLPHDYSDGVFTSADNGIYTVSIAADAVEDLDGNPSAAATLGTFSVAVPAIPANAVAPMASLQVSDLTDSTQLEQLLRVTYSGPSPIATNTLDNYDLQVTGPDGDPQNASFVSSTMNTDGSTTATYEVQNGFSGPIIFSGVSASGRTVTGKSVPASTSQISEPAWGDQLANGSYIVSLVANQVNDQRGVPVTPGVLGTFQVNQAQRPPTATPFPLFDSSSLAALTAGKATNVDAHHVSLAGESGKGTHETPTRAHAVTVAHHHKKKKKHVSKPVVGSTTISSKAIHKPKAGIGARIA